MTRSELIAQMLEELELLDADGFTEDWANTVDPTESAALKAYSSRRVTPDNKLALVAALTVVIGCSSKVPA